MLELENSLAFYIAQRLQSRWSHLHFELSGATVAVGVLSCALANAGGVVWAAERGVQGEGEVKMIGRMLRPVIPTSPGDTFAVVGSDSDLYIMAMLQQAASKVWVVPDVAPGRGRRGQLRSFSLAALDQEWSRLQQVQGGSSQARRATHRGCQGVERGGG